ncbi:hypothetical protein BC830DRAFT_673710 [Chytriomyces sp. MP71]|nr:hypothetical protein BC830DRAFT_673710 [Chytriomyces sp. MP71]
MFSQAGLSHKRDSTVGDKAIDGIKRATGKVVKEVMSGATYLGAMGLAAAKNYLQSGTNGAAASSVHIDVQGPDGSPEEGSERTTGDWRAEGVVAIRSFSLDSHFTPGVDASNAGDPSDLISHWKVHSNRISNLTLNHAQTLLFTSSTSANTFLIFSLAVPAPVQHNRRILTPQQCLYKLERGFTPATIESVSFSANGKWCAVSTARGTTHMYALPPVSAAFGGSRDFEKQYELGVLNGWTDAKAGNAEVVNAALRAVGGGAGNGGDGIVLYPAARIKQTVTFGGDGEGIVEGKDVHVDAVVSGRSALCVGFFLDRVPATASVPVANSVRKSNGAGIMGGGSPSLTGFLTGPSEADYSRLFRQRVLSMHPCGFVTLHHVDLGVYLNGDGASPVSLSSSFGTSPRFSSSASPRDASWNGLHQHLHGMPKVMVKDVMQWDIKRSENWNVA